jgi:hypothetical protein
LLLHSLDKITHAREPVQSGAASTKLLTDNLRAHTFKTKAIQWYRNLLINKNNNLNDMIGFGNGILVAYGMCPSCELLAPQHKLSFIRASSEAPAYFMQCPSTDIWELADA